MLYSGLILKCCTASNAAQVLMLIFRLRNIFDMRNEVGRRHSNGQPFDLDDGCALTANQITEKRKHHRVNVGRPEHLN